MAKKRRNKADFELPFPIEGLNTGMPNEKQPPLSSPNLLNVRPYDVEEERARGGQRPGLIKASYTQVSADKPIIAMTQITTTYVGIDS